ncbi:MAG: sigma-70 family RNA polymerase sigma factor [Verrucomicrobiales bacterium]
MEAIEQRPDLEQLFKECSEDLARYFSRRHEEGDKAQDLVQETFLKMARTMEKGARPEHFRAYLFGIARRVSQAAWARRDRERATKAEFPVEDVAAARPDDRIAAACEVIAGLPPLHREILDLRFSQGLSYGEIAEALDIPSGTVRSRLHYAILQVRHRLSEDEPETFSES